MAEGDHEIDCRGKWVTPGFIDCHAHAGVAYHAANGWVPPVDYVYKLWLAHGVTTVREMGSMNGLGWMLDQKKRSAENTIAAPRLLAYAYMGDWLEDVLLRGRRREGVIVGRERKA